MLLKNALFCRSNLFTVVVLSLKVIIRNAHSIFLKIQLSVDGDRCLKFEWKTCAVFLYETMIC